MPENDYAGKRRAAPRKTYNRDYCRKFYPLNGKPREKA